MDFRYQCPPFKHQQADFEAHYLAPYRGLLYEQRCGKSAVILYTAAQLHAEGKINSLFILAPNGVQRNWVSDEIPKHLPDWVTRTTAVWSADTTKKKTAELEALFDRGTQLRILAMNIEAIGTKRGYAMAEKFLRSTECLWAIDETTRIKNPDTITVKNIMKLRNLAKYRRILNGTPVTQSPLDVYSQLLFLSDEAVPVQSYVAFRHRYADYLPATHPLVRSIMSKTNARWAPQIVASNPDGTPAYKNLIELKEWVDKCCTRVTRAECGDMPEKAYKRWIVDYPAEQQKTVKYYLELLRKGETPEPVHKMTAVMLYQRLLCGLVPKQLSGEETHREMFAMPEHNPRLQAILQIVEEYPEARIVFWARFRHDLSQICEVLEKHAAVPVARYWGDISPAEREEAKNGFQAGRYQYFVGQQGAGGVGLPLHAADIICYHSNDFSLYHRIQSEDRAENLEKKTGTLIIDLSVPDTVDDKIIDALRMKKDVAALITGDEVSEWLK